MYGSYAICIQHIYIYKSVDVSFFPRSGWSLLSVWRLRECEWCLCFGNLALCRTYRHTAWPPKIRHNQTYISSESCFSLECDIIKHNFLFLEQNIVQLRIFSKSSSWVRLYPTYFSSESSLLECDILFVSSWVRLYPTYFSQNLLLERNITQHIIFPIPLLECDIIKHMFLPSLLE